MLPLSKKKKITQPLGTKKNHANSLDKKNYAAALDKNNYATSHDKKIMQPPGTKQIVQPPGTKTCNLSGQQKITQMATNNS